MKVLTPNKYIYPLKISNEKDWKEWNKYIGSQIWDSKYNTSHHSQNYTKDEYIRKEFIVNYYTYPFYIFKDEFSNWCSKKQHPRIKTWSIMCKELIHASPELKQELKDVLEKHMDIEIKLK